MRLLKLPGDHLRRKFYLPLISHYAWVINPLLSLSTTCLLATQVLREYALAALLHMYPDRG
jgi:hypothetical protein